MLNELTFWTYIEKELVELKSTFENIFPSLTLNRDYENTWEWLEGKTENELFELNISRKHNWKKGLYDKELVIIIKAKFIDDVDSIGQILRSKLSTTIYYGSRTFINGNEFQFEVEKQY